MKEFTLNKKSWHYWLASDMGKLSPFKDDVDFCSYFWYVIGGLFTTTICTALILGVAGVVLYTMYWWVLVGIALFNHAKVPFDGFAIAVTAIMVTILLLFGVAVFNNYRTEQKYKRMMLLDHELEEPEPGFMKLAYMKFKEKTCVKISFK